MWPNTKVGENCRISPPSRHSNDDLGIALSGVKVVSEEGAN